MLLDRIALMQTNQQFLELLNQCKRHLQGELKKRHFMRASEKLHSMHAPQMQKKQMIQPVQTKPIPQIVPAKPLTPKPEQTEPSKAPVAQVNQEKKSEIKSEIKLTPNQAAPFSIQILPHLFTPTRLSLSDIQEKLLKLSPQIALSDELNDVEAQKKADLWMQKYPQIAVVIFSSKNSSVYTFTKNVTDAIHSRIRRAKLYDAQDAASKIELLTLVRASALQQIILAFEERLSNDVDAFVEHFTIEYVKSAASILQERGKAHTTKLYNLHVSDTSVNDVHFKAQLWNALKTL